MVNTMRVAHIYQVTKKSTQSGKAAAGTWQLEFDSHTYQDKLMGWVGSKDTQGQVCLSFPTREAAERYAQSEGIQYVISIEDEMNHVIKSYGDNFKRP